MSEHVPEQTKVEQFAKTFELAGPSGALRQAVLDSARATWSNQTATRAQSDSLVPYFAALAATLLMIITVNSLGNNALQAGLPRYVVTMRPCETLQLDEEANGRLPYQHSMALCIVGVSEARHRAHFNQLQTLLSQGASL